MNILKIFIQSFIIGLAKVMPGVSGSVLAISFGLYEKGIEAISMFFRYPKKYFGFLFVTGSAVFIAMICGSTIISFLLKYYYLPVMLLFLGTILGGIVPIGSMMKSKLSISNLFFMVIVLILFIGLMSIPITKTTIFQAPSFVIYFLIGLIDAATMVIPGISGTAILIVLGLYPLMLECLSSFTNSSFFLTNISHLIPYLLGLALGIYVVSLLMNYLFHRFPIKTYCMIFMLSISSVLLLVKELFSRNYQVHEVILGTILFFIGLKVSTIFEANA